MEPEAGFYPAHYIEILEKISPTAARKERAMLI
jgi:hypothetical protein